jgi:hypothetical protein
MRQAAHAKRSHEKAIGEDEAATEGLVSVRAANQDTATTVKRMECLQ